MPTNPYEFSFILRKKLEKKIIKILFFILLVFIIITLFLRFVLFSVFVKSESMEPTLKTNSAVFVTPLIKKRDGFLGSLSLKRGLVVLVEPQYTSKNTVPIIIADSVVSFFTLQQYFPFKTTHRISGNPCIRRLLALPGDTIYMEDYVLYIKPQGETHFLTEFEIINNSYNILIDSSPESWKNMGVSGSFEEIKLGPDEYFLLADNRTEGIDSRIWGTIPGSRINGKVVLSYFPFNHFSLF